MEKKYPYLQKYSLFLLDHHLNELIEVMISIAYEINIPLLKQLQHLSKAEIFEISKQGLVEDILIPLSEGTPFLKIDQKLSEWKENKLIVEKTTISSTDIIEINKARKQALVTLLKEYSYSNEEGIKLVIELEDFFSQQIIKSLQMHDHIQRQALEENQKILNGILKNIPVVVTQVSRDGIIRNSLGSGLVAMGLKEGELIGSNLFEKFPTAEKFKRAMVGESSEAEGVTKSKNGESRYFKSYFFPDEVGAIGFSIDITEQKTVEQKLSEREYFIKQIADSTPIIINLYDKINNVSLYSNRELFEVLGYSMEEFNAMGKSVSSLVHPEDLPQLLQRNEKIESAKDSQVVESKMRVKHTNGSYKTIYTRTTVFKRTDEGNVSQTLSTSIDISDITMYEEKLQQQLRIIDTALSNTPDYNYILDPVGRFTYINKSLLNEWGKDIDEVVGKTFIELDYPKYLASQLNRDIKTALTTKDSVRGENEFITEGGETRYFEYVFVPILDNEKNVEAIVGTTHDVTKLKLIAEQQYKSIFESANDAILIYDFEGKLVEVNPAGYKMHGYSYEEIIGKSWTGLIAPEDHKNFQQFLNKVKKGAQFFSEMRHLTKDGNILFTEKTGTPFSYKGRPHLLAVVHNISSRKKAEEALIESEERFRTLADNIPNLAWIADKDGDIFWYNKRWYSYTGTTEEEMLGWGWQKVHNPEFLSYVIEKWKHSIKSGTSMEMVFPIRGKDGKFKDFLTRVIPIKDKNGYIIRWFGTNTDISKLLKTEQALKRSEEFNRTLFNSSPDCVIALDLKGKILAINKQCLEMLDLASVADYSQIVWASLWDSEENEKIKMAFSEAVQGKIGHFQSSITKDGTVRWWDVLIAPVQSSSGNVDRLISVSRDITKLKELEQQKEDFLGIASHELKTPVSVIKAYTEVLHDKFHDIKDDSTANMLLKMERQLDKLTDLINDLLDVTKIEQGNLQLKKEEFNLNNLVIDIVDEIQKTTKRHQLEVILNPKEEFVVADYDRLGQVLTNLITNAIKYSPKADKIIISTSNSGKEEVCVSVEDFGLGLSEEDQKRVFERFYRVQGRGHESYPGMGLGLFICYGIIKRHGGEIFVKSKLGQGSKFSFVLNMQPKEV